MSQSCLAMQDVMDDANKELWPVGDDELSASTFEGETERKRMKG